MAKPSKNKPVVKSGSKSKGNPDRFAWDVGDVKIIPASKGKKPKK